MAYLNVAERRIEATIAYVGSAPTDIATNFSRLRQCAQCQPSAETGPLAPLTWQPSERARFRDCSVMFHVVTHQDFSDDEPEADALRNADGVVVVLDRDPGAGERNRACLDLVRESLARKGRRDVAIVLQVNSGDDVDALSVDDVVGPLDAVALLHVDACAAKGTGVVETLETALREVLSVMQSQEAPTVHTDFGGGHPLLSALRQVLRGTLEEHLEELENRMTARIDESLARVEGTLASVEAATVGLRLEVSALASPDAHELLIARVAELLHANDARIRGLEEIINTRASRGDMSALVRAHEEARAAVAVQVSHIPELLRHELNEQATRKDIDSVMAALGRVQEAMKSEMTRAGLQATLLRGTEARVRELTTAVLGNASREDVSGVLSRFERLAGDLRSQEERFASALVATGARVEEIASVIDAGSSRADVAAVDAHLGHLREELKGNTARASEALARTEREVVATTSAIRKAVETLTDDVRAGDVREPIKATLELLTTTESAAGKLVERLDHANAALRSLPARFEPLEAALARIAEGEQATRQTVVAGHTDVTGALHATDANIAALQLRVDELIGELKKTRKGWFG